MLFLAGGGVWPLAMFVQSDRFADAVRKFMDLILDDHEFAGVVDGVALAISMRVLEVSLSSVHNNFNKQSQKQVIINAWSLEWDGTDVAS
jgi:hypothetical protein